ncbi:MAG: NmrA family protein, partial [Marmoricola sp.]|nr:NmrA family protein [Marmoricola sp.]
MAIVVTGATGQLGRGVAEALLERGVEPAEVVATGRRTEALADLAERGVRTQRLDFSDVGADVFSAGDVVLLVSGSEVGQRVAQHRAVVDAAAAAGVAHLAYTSAPAADDTTLVLAPEHAATEEIIRASGLPFTFLRNGWYTENYRQAFDQAAATGVVLDSVGEGRVASAPRQEYAEAAAVVLLAASRGEQAGGTVLELSGDRAWSFEELVAAFAETLGRDVERRPLSPEDHRRALVEVGLDEGTAGFEVALDQNIRDGLLAVT